MVDGAGEQQPSGYSWCGRFVTIECLPPSRTPADDRRGRCGGRCCCCGCARRRGVFRVDFRLLSLAVLLV